jgi:hypothetical protein
LHNAARDLVIAPRDAVQEKVLRLANKGLRVEVAWEEKAKVCRSSSSP